MLSSSCIGYITNPKFDFFVFSTSFATKHLNETCAAIRKHNDIFKLNDGFKVSFDVKEFKYKICSDLGLGLEKKNYGYTMSFTVRWE